MTMMYTETEINDITGFENGDRFENNDQVREYFTADNIASMFSDLFTHDVGVITRDGKTVLTHADLEEMARLVIENRWHYAN